MLALSRQLGYVGMLRARGYVIAHLGVDCPLTRRVALCLVVAPADAAELLNETPRLNRWFAQFVKLAIFADTAPGEEFEEFCVVSVGAAAIALAVRSASV